MFNNQKGIVHLLVPLIIVALLVGAGLFLYFGVFKKTSFNPFKKEAKVELKTEYKNPFAKETQYVNPFDEYKNPFVVNR